MPKKRLKSRSKNKLFRVWNGKIAKEKGQWPFSFWVKNDKVKLKIEGILGHLSSVGRASAS